MLKIENAQNRTKPEQPERSRRCDSGTVNGLQNRCRMRKISCFVCFPKQQNFVTGCPASMQVQSAGIYLEYSIFTQPTGSCYVTQYGPLNF